MTKPTKDAATPRVTAEVTLAQHAARPDWARDGVQIVPLIEEAIWQDRVEHMPIPVFNSLASLYLALREEMDDAPDTLAETYRYITNTVSLETMTDYGDAQTLDYRRVLTWFEHGEVIA